MKILSHKFDMKWSQKLTHFFYQFSPYLIFILLAGVNPFSTRNLISNLEPYPDSLYYLYPAWNLVKNYSFSMHSLSSGVWISNLVPPVYSLLLLPFIAIFQDVRGFYFGNILAMFLTIFYVKKIIEKIIIESKYKKIIIFSSLFLLVTSKFFYTLPLLPMAENASLLFFTLILYFLLFPIENPPKKAIYSLICVVLLFFVKFSNLPIVVVSGFFLIYKNYKSKKTLFFSLLAGGLVFLLFLVYIWTGKIVQSQEYVWNFYNLEALSNKYLWNNLLVYINALFGEEISFLWWRERIWTSWFSVFSFFGLILLFREKKLIQVGAFLLSVIFSLILYMSRLIVVDGRYIFIVIIPFTIGWGVFLHHFLVFFEKIKAEKILLFLLVLLIFSLSSGMVAHKSQLLAWKQQIGINWRHALSPWNYIAVEHFNSFFAKVSKENQVLLTALPIFYLDFYQNAQYQSLPLSSSQEFFQAQMGYNFSKIFRAKYSTENIEHVVQKMLDKGMGVYISNAYLGNSQKWQQDFDKIAQSFTFQIQSVGCENTCNIYQIIKK